MAEHPFAQYIRILGKGKKGKRPLTQQEAFDAMDMIFRYDVEPEQICAFLMLMRVKEETAEEVAGFVQAIRTSIPRPMNLPKVSIDWPSYAGKRRQLPWYMMAAVVLSQNNYPVFMHGLSREDERIYSEQVLEVLGLKACRSLPAVVAALKTQKFAYLDIEFISSLTAELLDTRDLLGLRSPLHTVVRMLNPFSADLSLHSVFHPNYAEIHQQASALMKDKKAIAFKGEGGENERIPERACSVYGLSEGMLWKQEWPALLPPGKYGRETFPDIEHFSAVWKGDVRDDYAEAAITGTMALCLQALEGGSQQDALKMASDLWQSRQLISDQEQCA